MKKRLCKYGCGQKGVKQLKDGSWICSDDWRKCPVNIKIYENSVLRTLQREVAAGKHVCNYCGKPAKFVVSQYKACCVSKSKNCSGYHNHMSKIHKQKYKDNPELLESQREHIKKIAKDPEVSRKKSEKMLILHNEDCDTCKDFRKNYKKGKSKHSIEREKVWIEFLLDLGFKREELPTEHKKIYRKYSNEKYKLKKMEKIND